MPNITSNEIFVFSEAELLTKIHDFVENEKFHDLHIMAGHFMLFYDNQKNKLVPGIFEDINSTPLKEKIRSRIGIFPSYSWHLGVQLAEHHISKNQKSANLLLLINDWQYVPDKESNYDYRAEFYSSFTELPPTYISRLQSSNIVSTKNIIARDSPNKFPQARDK
ncbi:MULTISPECIES: LPD16 domain-containing protein [Pseudomonas]|uniref:LPD16 domain-containing protein n=1 Tax=Pseudomonas guariconensis TaxID=1288410 RepID=UPI002096C160|nr:MULTISPECIES: LPD16 domain-containing protein [Pseudomonas]MCO7597506.1 hypothetical protein [Pseudomonas guariconensis]MCU7223243.1 hypothetical protein [Pseudomonas brassicacearum]